MYGEEVAALRGVMHLPRPQVESTESAVAGVLRSFEFRERLPVPQRGWKIPGGTIKVLINLGEPVRLLGGQPAWQASSDTVGLVIGPQAGPSFSERSGLQHSVQVQLTPPGAFAMFGVPMSELSNTVADLRDLLGPRGHRLIQQVTDADAPARLASLRTGVEHAVLAGPAVDPAIAWAWRRMHQVHGEARVSALAAEVGMSRRHFARRFHQQIGLSPKRLARIVRIQRVLSLVNRGMSLSDAAARCGYYDQPHLDNDFRELTGRAPSEVFGRRRAQAS